MKRPRTQDLGIPADPKTRPCDWCHRVTGANSAWEIHQPRKKVGTAQFLYACPQHEELAKESSRAPRRAA